MFFMFQWRLHEVTCPSLANVIRKEVAAAKQRRMVFQEPSKKAKTFISVVWVTDSSPVQYSQPFWAVQIFFFAFFKGFVEFLVSFCFILRKVICSTLITFCSLDRKPNVYSIFHTLGQRIGYFFSSDFGF